MTIEHLLDTWPCETISDDSPEASETRCVACVHKVFQCAKCAYIDNQSFRSNNIRQHLSMTKHIVISGAKGTGKSTLANRIVTTTGLVSYPIKPAKEVLNYMSVNALTWLFSNTWIIIDECDTDDIMKIRDISRVYPTGHTIIFITTHDLPESYHTKFRVLKCSIAASEV